MGEAFVEGEQQGLVPARKAEAGQDTLEPVAAEVLEKLDAVLRHIFDKSESLCAQLVGRVDVFLELAIVQNPNLSREEIVQIAVNAINVDKVKQKVIDEVFSKSREGEGVVQVSDHTLRFFKHRAGSLVTADAELTQTAEEIWKKLLSSISSL